MMMDAQQRRDEDRYARKARPGQTAFHSPFFFARSFCSSTDLINQKLKDSLATEPSSRRWLSVSWRVELIQSSKCSHSLFHSLNSGHLLHACWESRSCCRLYSVPFYNDSWVGQ